MEKSFSGYWRHNFQRLIARLFGKGRIVERIHLSFPYGIGATNSYSMVITKCRCPGLADPMLPGDTRLDSGTLNLDGVLI
jgi:hypothetical protein